MCAAHPLNSKIDRRAARAWTRWAGLWNGRIAASLDRVFEFSSVVGIGQSMSHRGTITTRVRRIRRGAREGVEVLPDEVEALWCPTGGAWTPVIVSLELGRQVVHGEDIALPLVASIPAGTLDRSPRPRAVDSANVELDSGVVLRTGDGLATLLMRKEDLAVLAILAGWPAPNGLPHGQDAREIAALEQRSESDL